MIFIALLACVPANVTTGLSFACLLFPPKTNYFPDHPMALCLLQISRPCILSFVSASPEMLAIS